MNQVAGEKKEGGSEQSIPGPQALKGGAFADVCQYA